MQRVLGFKQRKEENYQRYQRMPSQGHHWLVQTSEKKEMGVQCEETMAVQNGTVAEEEGEQDGTEGDNTDVALEAPNLPSKSLDSDSDSDSAFGSDVEEEC